MQISKIGSNASFNGLWSFKNKKETYSSKKHCKVLNVTATYHPFKDERIESIMNALAKEQKHPVYEYWYDEGDPWTPEHIMAIDHKVGERLNITAKEYAQIASMDPKGHPETEVGDSCSYHIGSKDY